MKTFIIRSLLFATFILLSSYPVFYMLSNGIKKSGDNYTTWNDIVSSSIKSDIIINGSSRAMNHINPFILDSILDCQSYNLSITGSFFSKQYVRYLFFEKYNEKPKYLIQQIDYTTLSNADYEFDDRFLPYISYIDKALVKNHLKWIKNYHLIVPLSRYLFQKKLIIRGILEFSHVKHFSREETKGFQKLSGPFNSKALNQILQGDSLIGKNEPAMVELFDCYLNHCKQNNIYVILVFSPQYYKVTDFTTRKKEILDIYNSVSGKYNFSFLDYSTDSMCYDTIFFHDAGHMNYKGSTIFSIKLAHDIDSIRLKLSTSDLEIN